MWKELTRSTPFSNSCLDDVESGAEIDKVLIKLSPKLRTEIEEPLKRSLKDFQSMAFAPEEILGPTKTRINEKRLSRTWIRFLKIDRKTRVLSLCSGLAIGRSRNAL